MDDALFRDAPPARGPVPWRTSPRAPHARRPLQAAAAPDVAQGVTGPANYCRLGAHPAIEDGVLGTRFAVWAPNAHEVSVVCDANGWTPGRDPLHGSDSGAWSGFVRGLGHGDVYKYAIRTASGAIVEKADPYAFFAEHPPRTASIVYDVSDFPWSDGEWLDRRRRWNWLEAPVSIYEVHLGSWRRPDDGRRYLNYRELSETLVPYALEMGYTHLQLMPVSEYPFDGSWGYQCTGYFAPTSRYGDPFEFMGFVDACHRAGLGVLVDWVPAHFPTDLHGLARFDGTCCYEHSDPRQGYHPDWNTLIFNYGRFEVRDFLLSSARWWLETYHVDGLRVDAVASMLYLDYSRKEGEWIPNEHGGRENLPAIAFLRDLNAMVHADFPGAVTIAEESTAWRGVSRPVYDGGLGFSMKWDMGWMNDTLRYMRRDPVHRRHHQNELSFRMMYAFSENFVLPLSHDEVVHGKRSLLTQMPGDNWQKLANLRLLYGYQYAMPGKKLLFMGGELGQWTEWDHDGQLDWGLLDHAPHAGLKRFVADLNRRYRTEPALHEFDFRPEGFRWIECDDAANSTYAFIRSARDERDRVLIVFNFTPVVREGYRLGVPGPGFYREALNSDALIYGGSNVGNGGGLYTERVGAHDCPHSIALRLPPLGMLMLKPVMTG